MPTTLHFYCQRTHPTQKQIIGTSKHRNFTKLCFQPKKFYFYVSTQLMTSILINKPNTVYIFEYIKLMAKCS